MDDINGHRLIRALRTLELDTDDFVILGSGPMMAYGLRDSIADLDVVARGRAWTQALHRAQFVTTPGPITQQPLIRFNDGEIEIAAQWIVTGWDVDELIDNATTIGDLRFADLHDVLASKRSLNRPKDQADIKALLSILDAGGAAP